MRLTYKNEILFKYIIPVVRPTICNYCLWLLIGLILPIGYTGEVFGINIGAVGDISCESEGKNTIDNLANHQPQLILFLGDLSYENDQSCFFDMTHELENNSKILAALGNHDKRTIEAVSDHYGIPSEGYYTYDFDTGFNSTGLIIVMNTEGNSKIGSDQYEFVKSNLENSSNYKYKMVISHKNFISCECDHAPNVDYAVYQDLFNKYGVDLVLSGHNHNYQRFEPIDNVTYIVNGLGGASQYDLEDADEYNNIHKYGNKFSDAYGYLSLNLAKNNITGKFISNEDPNEIKDSFNIAR